MEGRWIFGSHEPTIRIDQISTKDLWESLDIVFTNQRNIPCDRYSLLTRKQLKGEPVENFYGCRRELSLNCDLGSHEESIIRDGFIANMQDGEKQKEILKETRSAKALEVAINFDMGVQNQLKISGIVAHSNSNQAANMSINSFQNSWNRARPLTNNFVKPTICLNSGYGWSTSHCQNSPACGKNFKNWTCETFCKIF